MIASCKYLMVSCRCLMASCKYPIDTWYSIYGKHPIHPVFAWCIMHHASCIMHDASCMMHDASCIMHDAFALCVLTNFIPVLYHILYHILSNYLSILSFKMVKKIKQLLVLGPISSCLYKKISVFFNIQVIKNAPYLRNIDEKIMSLDFSYEITFGSKFLASQLILF